MSMNDDELALSTMFNELSEAELEAWAMLPTDGTRRDRPTHYILDDLNQAQPASLLEWAEWLERADRHVAKTTCAAGQVWISTVFLGLDHSMGWNGPPILFETMIFGGKYNEHTERYTSYEEARIHHHILVERVESTPIWKHVLANVREDLVHWWDTLKWEVRSWRAEDSMVPNFAFLTERRKRRWWQE